MFLLYHGSGSGEVQLLGEHNQATWGLIRKKAINYLTLSGARESAELLSGLPFQHWAGANSFGDEFDLLYLSISVTQYLKLKLDAETKENKHRFKLIADALQETGNGSVAKFRHGRRTSATLPYPQASSGLGFESFTDDCDGLRERTGTNAESALDDARLAADVLREVEDRRLALA